MSVTSSSSTTCAWCTLAATCRRSRRRVLQRVTLGTKGYLDLYPHLANYEWDASGNMVEGDAFAS